MLMVWYNVDMIPRNRNNPNIRPVRATPGAKVGGAGPVQAKPARRPMSMRNRPIPGQVRRQAAMGDATLGVRSRYTPIAEVVSRRQEYNSGSSMSVATRPRGLGGPRAL